jgi:hypothetical protein
MSRALLIPNHYKRLGFIIFVPFFILGAIHLFADFNLEFLNFLTDEVALTGTIIGLMLIAFSQEKIEDEFIGTLRLQSLQWAVIINYILLIIASWVFYGMAYLHVMIYNMLTIPIIFIIRFHYVLAKNKAQ